MLSISVFEKLTCAKNDVWKFEISFSRKHLAKFRLLPGSSNVEAVWVSYWFSESKQFTYFLQNAMFRDMFVQSFSIDRRVDKSNNYDARQPNMKLTKIHIFAISDNRNHKLQLLNLKKYKCIFYFLSLTEFIEFIYCIFDWYFE